MKAKIATRTKRDKTLASILGIYFGICVAQIVWIIIFEFAGVSKDSEFPPVGYVAVIEIGLLATCLGFRLLDLLKSLKPHQHPLFVTL